MPLLKDNIFYLKITWKFLYHAVSDNPAICTLVYCHHESCIFYLAL